MKIPMMKAITSAVPTRSTVGQKRLAITSITGARSANELPRSGGHCSRLANDVTSWFCVRLPGSVDRSMASEPFVSRTTAGSSG